ncbi:YiiX/YebB-like N1pC/P60 family cysteine hydrolase [Jiulongibacter sp. NS-SX5]|uniref:YiiX/YebB-like N1pC/P60 family cysteine hydrolase n=1 Tax=Jiulongibacter sp. NS-SX5 TaxID=3463854 RepID=UPI00405A25A1
MALPLYKKSKLEKLFPRSDSDTNLQNYNKIRSELQTGDFLFFSGDHWLSSLIRSRSRSAWSHVGIVIKLEELDRVFLVESVLENGIRMVPMSFVFKDYDGAGKPYVGRVGWARHTEIGSDPKKQRIIKEFCLDNLTKQYDRAEYYRILWRSFTGLREIFEDDKYTCAEFIKAAFEKVNVEPPREYGYFISPGAYWRMEEMEMMSDRLLI